MDKASYYRYRFEFLSYHHQEKLLELDNNSQNIRNIEYLETKTKSFCSTSYRLGSAVGICVGERERERERDRERARER